MKASRLVLTCGSFFVWIVSFGQINNENIKADDTTRVELGKLDQGVFKKNNNIQDLTFELSRKVSDNNIKNFLKQNDSLNTKAVIVIKHQFNYIKGKLDSTNPESNTKDDIYILHKEKEVWSKKGLQWTEYLLNIDSVMVVFIGGEGGLQESTIKIVKEKSFFASSISDLSDLINVVGGIAPLASGGGPKISFLPVRIFLLNPKKLDSPCSIQIIHSGREEPLEVKIHEKNYFAFQVGVSAQQLNRNQVQLQNQQLTVALDTTQQKEWKSNLIVMLNFYPFGGRDIDRYEVFYKQGLKDRAFGPVLYKWFFSRLGVFGGARLSTDPIQNLYLGTTYAFSKSFNFNFGYTWANTLTPQVTTVGDINSIRDAVRYAKRDYEGQLFLGVSFAPSAISEILGLNKGEEEKEK